MSKATRPALFISHATPDDNHFVRWLGAKLTAIGYEVWADVLRLQGGHDWARDLEAALRQRAGKMILVCTPSGLDKQGVRNEIEMAVSIAKGIGDPAFIIPLRLEPYELPFRIAQIQYIDFVKSWAAGLKELTDLLGASSLPRTAPNATGEWLESHAEGADRLLQRTEPLVSNWLQVTATPEQVHIYEPVVGASREPFLLRSNYSFAAVPHHTGAITFAHPGAEGDLGAGLRSRHVASIPTRTFLFEGWLDQGIDIPQARNAYFDLGAQAFDRFCQSRGLKGVAGAGGRLSWWADIKVGPTGQVRFDWGYRRGSRQVIGQSGKRGVHWHYALSGSLRAYPLWHFRLSPRLVFSENGIDAIEDARRAHTLRRSFAKGWRNPRWRDMLCAYLWWLAKGGAELNLPVGSSEAISLSLAPMQFSCPVTVFEGDEAVADEDDPDLTDDAWTDEVMQADVG